MAEQRVLLDGLVEVAEFPAARDHGVRPTVVEADRKSRVEAGGDGLRRYAGGHTEVRLEVTRQIREQQQRSAAERELLFAGQLEDVVVVGEARRHGAVTAHHRTAAGAEAGGRGVAVGPESRGGSAGVLKGVIASHRTVIIVRERERPSRTVRARITPAELRADHA